MEKSGFKTYLQVAQELFESHADYYNEDAQNAILSFAKYLDSWKSIDSNLQFLAMQKSREIDRELFAELEKTVGRDVLMAAARIVNARHMHHKSFVEPNKSGTEA